MSTPRRILGAGPMTSTRSTATSPAPRLLPVERAEHDDHQDDDVEHQAVQMLRGRRILGTGPAGGAS